MLLDGGVRRCLWLVHCRGAIPGVLVVPGWASGASGGGSGPCRRPVGCLRRGQAWLGWVLAVAARSALWLTGADGLATGSQGFQVRRPVAAASVVGV